MPRHQEQLHSIFREESTLGSACLDNQYEYNISMNLQQKREFQDEYIGRVPSMDLVFVVEKVD